MDLGPHAVFIWLSYLATVIAVAGIIGWLVLDGRRYARKLAELEARGVRRRSAATVVAERESDQR
jgi:heme exporter protein D